MKDHEIALLVNELTAIARDSGQTQQLHGHISEAVLKSLRCTETPVTTDEKERSLFAEHMEAQGFRRDAVAPPKPPMRHYRSSHVETCWEAWAGCLKAHGLSVACADACVPSEAEL